MTEERWKDVVGQVQDSFPVEEHVTEQLDPGPGSAERIIFQGPLGRMKLERTTRPVLLGTRGLGSKRMGSQATVQYQYSDTEESHSVKAYQWNEAQRVWVEMEKERSGTFTA